MGMAQVEMDSSRCPPPELVWMNEEKTLRLVRVWKKSARKSGWEAECTLEESEGPDALGSPCWQETDWDSWEMPSEFWEGLVWMPKSKR